MELYKREQQLMEASLQIAKLEAEITALKEKYGPEPEKKAD